VSLSHTRTDFAAAAAAAAGSVAAAVL